jgi:outer membrane protein OmpA-like peptidoglycan-associated protein
MNRMLLLLLIGLFMIFSAVIVNASDAKIDYGVAIGGAIGDNVYNRENWVPTFRAHWGIDIAPIVYTELSGRYISLDADFKRNGTKGYETSTAIIDWRLVLSPFHQGVVEPYLAAGVGVSKNVDYGDSDIQALIPFALGIRFELAPQLMLDLSGTYDLFLTDEIDGMERGDKLNPVTGDKHDAFYGFLVGFTIVPDRVDHEAIALAEKLRMEEEAKRAALLADPDGDGLTTGDELNTFLTDPLAADTDGDGLSDSAEIRTYKSDPLAKDTDKDGLGDGDEVNTFSTNPIAPDTDGDGLNDGSEVSLHKTDPTKADSDGDSLLDSAELNKWKTDPLAMDTDMGGMNDGLEVDKNQDPLDASDDGMVLETGKTLVLKGVNFKTSSAEITANSLSTLEEVYTALMEFPDAIVEIAGHSDSSGNDDFNMDLSRKRAEAVKAWLVGHGIDASRLSTVGIGENEPIGDNTTSAGRAQNRRIEFNVK